MKLMLKSTIINYNFPNPRDTIDNFLSNVHSKFVPRNIEVVVKCALKLQNVQLLPTVLLFLLLNLPVELQLQIKQSILTIFYFTL